MGEATVMIWGKCSTAELYSSIKVIFNYMHVCLCVGICTRECRCLQSPEEGTRSLELEFQVVYQPSQLWDLNLRLWQEQYEVLHLNLLSTIPQHTLFFLNIFYFKTRSH